MEESNKRKRNKEKKEDKNSELVKNKKSKKDLLRDKGKLFSLFISNCFPYSANI